MTFIKTLASALLVSTLAFGTAVAAEQKAPAQSKAAAAKNDRALKQFNDSVRVALVNRQLAKDQKGQDVVVLGYEVENKNAKRDIRSVNFISVYTVNGNAVWGQEMPVKFEQPLKRKTKITISALVPLASIPEQARPHFTNLQVPIGSINGAKELVFTNGAKIVVK